ncbi:hypothetical protein [Tenacibaculum xiamenense]|uniref:hypothetical protein n=1 Tax=Tenacibaculum xiamenense TaxID=1261553 RepID=UPI0038937DC7
MNKMISGVCMILLAMSCQKNSNQTTAAEEVKSETENTLKVEGTWKLVYGEIKEKDSVQVKDLSKTDFIKIINKSHFAFFNQNKGTADGFYGGGGSYTLNGDDYVEKLEYVGVEAIRNHEFPFKVKIVGDTLIQFGKEEVKDAGINRDIIEKYIRVK